jgi:Putative transposase
MSRQFGGKPLFFPKRASEGEELQFADFAHVGEAFATFVSAFHSKELVVYPNLPFNAPETVFEQAGKLTHRVAITNPRTSARRTGRSPFPGRTVPTATRQRSCHYAFEFIGRFLLDVLPAGFAKTLQFGLSSNGKRKSCLEISCSPPGETKPEFVSSETWRDSFPRIAGVDVT